MMAGAWWQFGFENYPRPTRFSSPQLHTGNKHYGNQKSLVRQMPGLQTELKSLVSFSRNEVVLRSANLSSQRKLGFRVEAEKDSDPFRGKSGSISFGGLSHQSVEESKLESAPFKEETGSLLLVLAPFALISALIVPQFFIVTAIESAYENEVFAGHYPEWDEDHPIHFVGHSAGAQVVRVLQQMLADKAFEGYENTSPNCLLSITSLSGAFNGIRLNQRSITSLSGAFNGIRLNQR